MTPDQTETDITMDANSLYREDSFTDRQVGSIRQLTPVTPDGAVDSSRETLFIGSTQVLTPMGAVPINFEIEATNLADAVSGFADAAKQGLERTVQEINELRREASSGIVVPDAAGGGFGGPGAVGPAGAPGGRKIQLR